jgi:hypothetical protein
MKKGQVQLGESIAVIIIVIIMLIIGISFWARISSSDTEKILTDAQELSVIEIANSVSEFSELKCFDSNVNKVKCLDYYKLKAMSNLTNSSPEIREYYNNYFRNSKITVQMLYPEQENITIYDAKLNSSSKTLLIPIPVNVKNYITQEVFYGLILVEGYYSE